MSDPVPQVMNELLERMAAILVNQQLSPFVHNSGNRVANASQQLSHSSSVPDQRECEDRLLEHLSTLVDNRFRSLENGTLEPLRKVVEQLGERCGRIEMILQDRTETVTVDLHQHSKKSPSLTNSPPEISSIRRPAAPSIISTDGEGERFICREKQQSTDLLDRISRIAPTVDDLDTVSPPLSTKVDWTPASTPQDHEPVIIDRASSWSDASSSDNDSDGGNEADYRVGAKYDSRYAPEEAEKERKSGIRRVLRKVDIDKDPAAVRALKPRPCH